MSSVPSGAKGWDSGGFDRGFEGHRHRQVRRGLELTPIERLRWLEQTMEEMRRLVGRARKPVSPRLDRLIERAKSDPHILAVMLFGSLARGEGRQGSDLDVCLVLPTEKDARGDQQNVVAAYLDLNVGGLHVSVFQQLPLYVRTRVLREGKVVACRDEDGLYEVARRTTRAFEAFKHRHREYLEEVARA